MKKTTTTPTHEPETKAQGSEEVVISPSVESVAAPFHKDSKLVLQKEDGEGAPIPQDSKEIDIFSPELCGEIFGMIFSRIAVSKGEHWKLQDSEKATLGKTSSACLNKYLGEIFGEMPEVATFVISVVVVVAPRMMTDGSMAKNRQVAGDSAGALPAQEKPGVSDHPANQEPDSAGSKEQPGESN